MKHLFVSICIIFVLLVPAFGQTMEVSYLIQGPIQPPMLHDLQSFVYNTYMTSQMQGREFKKLNIIINSPGGYMDEGVGIYGYLITLPAMGIDVDTQVTGICASAAMIILQAGKVRSATVGSVLMTHLSYVGFNGETYLTKKDLEDQITRMAISNDRMVDVFARRMNVNKARLYKYFKVEPYYMDVSEAYQIGFIDIPIYSAKDIASNRTQDLTPVRGRK